MSEKQKLEFRGNATAEELKGYLAALAESFVSGPIVLESEGRHVVLEMGAYADFEIEAEQKKDKAKVTIDISWRLPTPAVATTGNGGLRISSTVPDAPAAEVHGAASDTTAEESALDG